MQKIERRFIKASLRADKSDGANYISGYAATFNRVSNNLGFFFERIAPGAFSSALKRGDDVRFLHNHDSNLIMARTSAGSLELAEDDKGLRFRAQLPATSYAKDLAENIRNGNISECSFGFIVGDDGDDWDDEKDEDGNLRTVRTITDLQLLTDVSTCTFPAYEGTSADLSRSRSLLFPEGVPAELRAHLVGRRSAAADDDDDCDCQCEGCVDGDCSNCSDTDCSGTDCRGCQMPTERLLQSLEDAPEDDRNAAVAKLRDRLKAHGLDLADDDDENSRAARRRRLELAMIE